MAQERCSDVELVYVADGLDEFESSWRLRGILSELPDHTCHVGIPHASTCQTNSSNTVLLPPPLLLKVKHVFADPMFERTARSFLAPTGHPWAALVMFDSLLVRSSAATVDNRR